MQAVRRSCKAIGVAIEYYIKTIKVLLEEANKPRAYFLRSIPLSFLAAESRNLRARFVGDH